MLTLSAIDAVAVGAFVVALIGLGVSARLRQSTTVQYLAAGRALSLPAFVATLVSTWYGGILGICESASYFGVGIWVMFGLPYYVFAILYGLVFAKRVRIDPAISIPERLHARFGRGAGLLSAGLLFLLAMPAAHVLMLAVLLKLVTGWPLAWCAIAAAATGVALLARGGLLADVRVSMLAFVAMYAGFAGILTYCLVTFPLFETWSSVPDKRLLAWDGGQGPLQVLSFFLLGAWTLIDPGFHQRVASGATPEVGRKGVLISAGFWFLFDLLSMSTAMYAVSLAPDLSQAGGSVDRLAIFPLFGERILPEGLKALFYCGMFGTIASAMTGYLLVCGATAGREIFARWRREASDARVVAWTRFGIAFAGAAAVAVGLLVESVVSLWYTWGGAVVGALLIPVAMGYGVAPRARIPNAWVVASIAAGALISFSWMAYGLATGNPLLNVSIGSLEFGLGTLVPGLVASAATLGLGAILAIIRGNAHDR